MAHNAAEACYDKALVSSEESAFRMLLLSLLIGNADAHYSVLVYGPTETIESTALGTHALVTSWDATQWAAATTSDFEAFQLIVIPEGGCNGPSASDLQVLFDTRATWQPAVTGNILVTHLAPVCHYNSEPDAATLLQGFLDHAAYWGGPGLWVSGDFGERDLDFMDAWGSFTSSNTSSDAVTPTDSTSRMWNGLSSSDLQGWGDIASGTIDSYPSGWTVEATNGAGDAVVVAFEGCDQDFDGYSDAARCGGDDCDDSSSIIKPGANEYCDSVDNDCDGVVDEDDAVDATVWYLDADSDGFGDPNSWSSSCSQPSGYVADLSDCDDTSAVAYPGGTEVCDSVDNDCDGTADESDAADVSTWYADGDGDGFGDPAQSQDACDQPSGFVLDDNDCDDADAGVYAGATEVYYDGIDQDCDGADACDWDLDGEDALACPSGTDCDDTDASINTSAVEIWYDAVDQDCDLWSDFDQDYDGYDGMAFGGGDCDDLNATVYPGAPEIPDGLDNDCNGFSEDDDVDGDGLKSEQELALGTDPNDGDTDGDGLSDSDETLAGTATPDTDADGTIDALDSDDDNDGISTLVEVGDYDWSDPVDSPPDTDEDGLIDAHDLDSDGDGILDAVEGETDTDGDGLGDWVDIDSDDDGVSDMDERPGDTDGDGVDDLLDGDDDGDGLDTALELKTDSDGDGDPDYLDTDSDADGLSDALEGLQDSDGDTISDCLDTDSDDDLLLDSAEGSGDQDSDGLEDFRDPDDDGDGMLTTQEAPSGVTVDSDSDGASDHLDLDSDGDGFSDEEEGLADHDGDGIRDSLDLDSDADGVPDSVEQAGDSDGDGFDDRLDRDDDGDDIRTAFEGMIDTDGDGVDDFLDEDSDGDGWTDWEEGLRDEDCDGLRNYVDADDDDGPCGTPSYAALDTGDTGVDSEKDGAGSCSTHGPSSTIWALMLCFLPLWWRRASRPEECA